MEIILEDVQVRRFFSTFSELLDNHEVFLC